MAQPEPFERSFSFTAFAQDFPGDPLPGLQLDVELNEVKICLDQILSNLERIQRDDGELANQSVGPDQIRPELRFGFNQVTDWTPTTGYATLNGVWYENNLYRATQDHESGTDFAADLAAGKWALVLDLASYVGTYNLTLEARDDAIAAQIAAEAAQAIATAARVAAETAETNAETAATTAAAQATAAAGSAGNAASSQTAAATSASNAANSASTATTQASEASAQRVLAQTAATTADTHKNTAQTAATNAQASATAANNAAANAGTHATNAQSAATTAGQAATEAADSAAAAAQSATDAANAAAGLEDGPVISAFGRTGVVTAQTGDYSAGLISAPAIGTSYTPDDATVLGHLGGIDAALAAVGGGGGGVLAKLEMFFQQAGIGLGAHPNLTNLFPSDGHWRFQPTKNDAVLIFLVSMTMLVSWTGATPGAEIWASFSMREKTTNRQVSSTQSQRLEYNQSGTSGRLVLNPSMIFATRPGQFASYVWDAQNYDFFLTGSVQANTQMSVTNMFGIIAELA